MRAAAIAAQRFITARSRIVASAAVTMAGCLTCRAIALEQPCEPNLGADFAPVRQPWYPVEECYGLIFAYMGPPAKKPVLATL